MLCPSCGNLVESEVFQSCACGARSVGMPDTTPIATIPQLGGAMIGLTLALSGAACFFSKWFVLLSIFGMIISYKALRNARRNPELFGGWRMAWTGFGISTLTVGLILTLLGFHLPRWIENRRIQQLAATEARMLEVSLALELYRQKHNSLPEQLSDLRREGLLTTATVDYWEGSIRYIPTGQLASSTVGKSQNSVPVFNQYRLVSAGADGRLNSADDIVLDNHVFRANDKLRITDDE